MSLIACGSIYLSTSWRINCLVMLLEEGKRFWCVWLLIHNIFRPLLYLPVDSQYSSPVEFTRWVIFARWFTLLYSSPFEIADSISLPVEVNNSTIELYLSVDSQYISPVEALSLIVESKPLPVEVNNSGFDKTLIPGQLTPNWTRTDPPTDPL